MIKNKTNISAGKHNEKKSYDFIYIPLGAAGFYGAEHSILDLADGMARQGKKVLILAENALKDGAFAKTAETMGLSIEWVDWEPQKNPIYNFICAYRVFSKVKAKIVHFNISWRRGMWIIGIAAKLLTKARLIGTMRGIPDPHYFVPRRKYLGFIPGLQLWHLREVFIGWVWSTVLDITVSINALDIPGRLVRDFGYNGKKIKIIYNGIHIRKELLSESEKNNFRAQMQLKKEDILLCYAGRLELGKGVEYILEALSRLPEIFRLIIIGDGSEKENLSALAGKLGICDRVRFLGFIEKYNDMIAASDILIIPSWFEPFGRVVIEAMNQAVPVIASRTGGMAEIFNDGVEGVYVKPNDVVELIRVINSLGNDKERLRAMGLAGRELVKNKYSIGRVIIQNTELYKELT